jgi:hypothetical protein
MPTVLTAIIPAGETVSDVVDLTGATAVVGIAMPPDWTSATTTILGSPDGVFFYELHDGVTGLELAFNVRPGSLVMLNPNRLRSCVAIKLRSGTASNPVVQEGTRQFGIVVEGDVVAQPGTGTTAHVIEDTTNDFHGVEQNFQAPGPMTVAVQAWLKSANRQAGFAIYNSDGGAQVYFDLAINEIYANKVHGTGFSIFNLAIEGPGPNGWWICSASIALAPISPTQTFRIMIDKDNSGSQAWPGDGASFIQIWQPALMEDGGSNLLVSPEDLTDPAWAASGATVQNFPNDTLPAAP